MCIRDSNCTVSLVQTDAAEQAVLDADPALLARAYHKNPVSYTHLTTGIKTPSRKAGGFLLVVGVEQSGGGNTANKAPVGPVSYTHLRGGGS